MQEDKDPHKFNIHWQLIVIVLIGVAVWGIFFWWAPIWALSSIAFILGAIVSVAMGSGYKRAAEQQMESDDELHREELQEIIKSYSKTDRRP